MCSSSLAWTRTRRPIDPHARQGRLWTGSSERATGIKRPQSAHSTGCTKTSPITATLPRHEGDGAGIRALAPATWSRRSVALRRIVCTAVAVLPLECRIGDANRAECPRHDELRRLAANNLERCRDRRCAGRSCRDLHPPIAAASTGLEKHRALGGVAVHFSLHRWPVHPHRSDRRAAPAPPRLGHEQRPGRRIAERVAGRSGRRRASARPPKLASGPLASERSVAPEQPTSPSICCVTGPATA
jgi:hypothetical protein